jgi:hypothetical protein
VCIGRTQHPQQAIPAVGFHHRDDHLCADPAALILGQDIDVSEIGDPDAIADRSSEADLLVAVIRADNRRRVEDRSLDGLAAAALSPIGGFGEILVNCVKVDPAGITIELDPMARPAISSLDYGRPPSSDSMNGYR